MLDEIWKLLDDEYKVYTESKRTRNKILKLIGQVKFTGTVYSKNGKEYRCSYFRPNPFAN